MRNCCYVNRMMYKSLVLSTKLITFISYKEVIQKLTLQIPAPCYSQRFTLRDSLKCQVPYFKSSTLGKERWSLQKHPFLLALHRWGHFARRNVCDTAAEIPEIEIRPCSSSQMFLKIISTSDQKFRRPAIL